MNDKNKKTDNKKPIKPLQKGRYAEKLNLKISTKTILNMWNDQY